MAGLPVRLFSEVSASFRQQCPVGKVNSPRMFWLLPQIRVEFQANIGETADTLNDDGQVNHLDGDT